MSLEQSEAIVLRVYPWSETSLVANLYTREFGKISAIAKGARRPKSPFEAALDLLSICHVVFISKSSDALDILTEAKLLRRFRAAGKDFLRLNCGFYVLELLDRLTDKGDAQPEIYDLSRASLVALEEPECDPRAVTLRYELALLQMTGNMPSLGVCAGCGCQIETENWVIFGILAGGVLCERCRAGARNTVRLAAAARDLMEHFSHHDWREIDVSVSNNGLMQPEITTQERASIRHLMRQFLTVLLDRKLQLHAFLEELGR